MDNSKEWSFLRHSVDEWNYWTLVVNSFSAELLSKIIELLFLISRFCIIRMTCIRTWLHKPGVRYLTSCVILYCNSETDNYKQSVLGLEVTQALLSDGRHVCLSVCLSVRSSVALVLCQHVEKVTTCSPTNSPMTCFRLSVEIRPAIREGSLALNESGIGKLVIFGLVSLQVSVPWNRSQIATDQ